MHVCMYVRKHVYVHACMHVCMYVCKHVYVYACMYVCMHAPMHVMYPAPTTDMGFMRNVLGLYNEH